MNTPGLTSDTQSLMNEFAEKRGMSKRAKQEFQASLKGMLLVVKAAGYKPMLRSDYVSRSW